MFSKAIDLHIKESLSANKSIAVISFHKCATSYFSSEILNKSKTHEFIDYQTYQYNHDKKIKPIINLTGYIYGILRIYEPEHPGYDLTMSLLHHKHIKKINTLFWIRDPRDILISMYYSFGFTHGLSDNPGVRSYQIKRRDFIQKLSLDEYVIHEAYRLRKKFEIMIKLIDSCPNTLVLKYEDMIHRYDHFYKSLSKVISLDDEMYEKIYDKTRPKHKEDKDSHKRSGKTGAYVDKLKEETITELNSIFCDPLNKLKY